MAMHEAGDVTCPRCGESLTEIEGKVEASGELDDDGRVTVPVECPACGAALDLVVESALPEALGVDVYVEDRREQ
jgi:ribosomal protein S27AE